MRPIAGEGLNFLCDVFNDTWKQCSRASQQANKPTSQQANKPLEAIDWFGANGIDSTLCPIEDRHSLLY